MRDGDDGNELSGVPVVRGKKAPPSISQALEGGPGLGVGPLGGLHDRVQQAAGLEAEVEVGEDGRPVL